jgi:hypothetical protein
MIWTPRTADRVSVYGQRSVEAIIFILGGYGLSGMAVSLWVGVVYVLS